MKVTVVGAGIAGLSTAWALTRSGHAVTLLEQADAIPAPLAASGDHHRMIRRAYGGLNGYGRTIDDAFAAWERLWTDLSARHVAEIGVLCVCQQDGDEAANLRAGFDQAGTPYTLFGAVEAVRSYPFLDRAAISYAFLNADGGALLCRRIARDMARWLTRHGAVVLTGARAHAIDPGTGTVILADGTRMAADRVVVTTGAWVLRLFPALEDALTTYRTYVTYVTPPVDLAPAWATAPAILSLGGDVAGYVLPPAGDGGLKFGADFVRRPAGPEDDRTAQTGEGERLVRAFGPPLARIDEYVAVETVTCAYTFTEDERFLARRFGRTLVISACSGHAYKFGAAIGERVADAVTTDDMDTLTRWLRAEIPALEHAA